MTTPVEDLPKTHRQMRKRLHRKRLYPEVTPAVFLRAHYGDFPGMYKSLVKPCVVERTQSHGH